MLVKKKDGLWRLCIDCRLGYPALISLDALTGIEYFSTLDLTSGYWQVPLSPDSREKSAFATRSGLWRCKVLPFELTSAPATFQRLMKTVLQGLH